jgi:hypothetical protein
VGVVPGASSPSSPSAPSGGSVPARGPVVVRRSGGILGQVVEGHVDPDDPAADPELAREVRELVDRVDLAAAAAHGNQPDRYTYRVRLGDGDAAQEADVPEAALTDDLRRLVTLVLGDR